MKKSILFLFLLILSFDKIISKPFSINDRQLTILYFCNLNGNLEFDEQGRKGLPIIAEIKRREAENIFNEKGGVLLITQGAFFSEKSEEFPFKILKTALFDSVLLSERELSYIEKNPNLLKINLPILANRDNSLDIDTEKVFDLDGVRVKVNNYLIKKIAHNTSNIPGLNLIFPQAGEEIDLENIPTKIPVIYFLDKEKTASYSFSKNVYTAECPDSGDKIGKIKLTYRNGELIRQSQEFISLNSKNHNSSWIKPHTETMKELQKN